MANALMEKGYHVVSGGTDNHLLLVDLRKNFPDLTGKVVENTLVRADITINKNMVPFDSRSPFQTSGMRLGTAAVTTRGLKENHILEVVNLIDQVICNINDENVINNVSKKVKELMHEFPLFGW